MAAAAAALPLLKGAGERVYQSLSVPLFEYRTSGTAGTKRHPRIWEFAFHPSLLELGGAVVGLAVASWVLGIGVHHLSDQERTDLEAQRDALLAEIDATRADVKVQQDLLAQQQARGCVDEEYIGGVYLKFDYCQTYRDNLARAQQALQQKLSQLRAVDAKLGIGFEFENRTRFDPTLKIF